MTAGSERIAVRGMLVKERFGASGEDLMEVVGAPLLLF
jgi:hypothetical protein